MGQDLIITRKDGSTYILHSSGANTLGVDTAEQKIELNSTDTITIKIITTSSISFSLGDTIDIYGKKYTINQLPQIIKSSSRYYEYDVTFEGEQYLLINAAWMMPFSAINDSYTGDLGAYITLLVSNLNRIYPNMWDVGTIKSGTDTLTLTYSDTNCLDVLQQICDEYDVEFSIDTDAITGIHTINAVDKIGSIINHTFTYGKPGGLYELQRNGADDEDFGTRIYFYGGSTNISNDYYNTNMSTRLCLAGTNRNTSYIQNTDAINTYGVIERTKVFSDIYPNRIGSVTSIDSVNRLAFSDSTMFNLNETDGEGNTLYLINGTTAKIHFNTGALAGYEFEIANYNTSAKQFIINEMQDENNMVFPSVDNETFRVAVGDEYILTDIVLPPYYTALATDELLTAAQEHYQEHCAPALAYTLTVDDLFMRRLAADLAITDGKVFNIGDTIVVSDAQLGFYNKSFRIISLTRDLLKDYSYTLEIAESNVIRMQIRWRRRTRNRDMYIDRNDMDNPLYASLQSNTRRIGSLNTLSINTLNGTVAGHTTEIASLSQDVGDINASVTDINDDITGINATLVTHTNNISALNQDIIDANANISDLDTGLTTVQGTVAGHTTQIGAIDTTVAGHTTEIASLGESVSRNTDNIYNLNENLNSAYVEINKTVSNIGYDDFSELEDYTIDTVVKKDGLLYRFTAAHPAGAWIGTDATETNTDYVRTIDKAISSADATSKVNTLKTWGFGSISDSATLLPARIGTESIGRSKIAKPVLTPTALLACNFVFTSYIDTDGGTYLNTHISDTPITIPKTTVDRAYTSMADWQSNTYVLLSDSSLDAYELYLYYDPNNVSGTGDVLVLTTFAVTDGSAYQLATLSKKASNETRALHVIPPQAHPTGDVFYRSNGTISNLRDIDNRVSLLIANVNALAAQLDGYHVSACDDSTCHNTSAFTLPSIDPLP